MVNKAKILEKLEAFSSYQFQQQEILRNRQEERHKLLKQILAKLESLDARISASKGRVMDEYARNPHVTGSSKGTFFQFQNSHDSLAPSPMTAQSASSSNFLYSVVVPKESQPSPMAVLSSKEEQERFEENEERVDLVRGRIIGCDNEPRSTRKIEKLSKSAMLMNIGMTNSAYFVGRSEVLTWINSTLQLNLSKVEDVCSGVIHCQLMDSVHPRMVSMHTVIAKHIEVNKLVKGKLLNNLEIMQWMKRYYDSVNTENNYNPLEKRDSGKGVCFSLHYWWGGYVHFHG